MTPGIVEQDLAHGVRFIRALGAWSTGGAGVVGGLGALRKMPGGLAPKVIFCTTENEVGHIARAMHAGADEYIMKPFDQHIVRSKFKEIGLV